MTITGAGVLTRVDYEPHTDRDVRGGRVTGDAPGQQHSEQDTQAAQAEVRGAGEYRMTAGAMPLSAPRCKERLAKRCGSVRRHRTAVAQVQESGRRAWAVTPPEPAPDPNPGPPVPQPEPWPEPEPMPPPGEPIPVPDLPRPARTPPSGR